MSRIATYIDGFNLYFGLKAAGYKRYYWLDLQALSSALLKPGQVLVTAHYFTSRIRSNGANTPDMQRQSDYLDALATRPRLSIHFGHFLEKQRSCRQCGSTWTDYEEKMTDVNIAAQLLCDAHDDVYDTAIIISGDSDLTTPVKLVRSRFPQKRIIIALPPKRHSNELQKAASGFFKVNETALRHSQLPLIVPAANGHPIHRPMRWK